MFISGILLIAVGLCGLVLLVMYHMKRLHLYREVTKFTGPPGIPIIGNALYFLGDTEDLLRKMRSLFDTYPSPFRLWLGSRLYIAIFDADCVKTVLNSSHCLDKDDVYKYTNPYIGTGLISAPAVKWRIHRKLIQPTFNSRILDSFVETFAKQSHIMMNKMSKEVNKSEFDIFEYISRCAFDTICETTMGVCLNAQTEKENRYFKSTNRVTEIVYLRMYQLWLHPDFLFNLTKLGKDHKDHVEYLHTVTDEVLESKANAHKIDNRVTDETATQRAMRGKTFLDLLLELSKDGEKFTSEELRDEVNTILIAGSETNAVTDCFALLMLANYPEVQEKVYQELCEIYGDKVASDTPVQKEDLKRMEYMDRVLKETLRLFPPVPIMARAVTDDINIGDRILPKGSGVVMGLIQLHRSEEYWPDPLKFDPDRFLPEEIAKRHPYAYLPFSAGPRGCLGLVYAMTSMKIHLATLLRRYIFKKDKFFNVEDLKLKLNLMLKPVEPITLKIVERPKVQSKNRE